jgi:hypothetical protein
MAAFAFSTRGLVSPWARLSPAQGPWKCTSSGVCRSGSSTGSTALNAKCASTTPASRRARAERSNARNRVGNGSVVLDTATTPGTVRAIGPTTRVRASDPARRSARCRSWT